jgi:hypothetical protein
MVGVKTASKKIEIEKQDELMIAVQIELDKTVTREVCEAIYETASLQPQDKNEEKLEKKCKKRKNTIMGVLTDSVSLQRLYFVVRSSVMASITGILTFSIISALAITNFLQLVLLGLMVFVASLISSRVLDKPIIRICQKTISFLNKHRRIKSFVLSRF